MYRNVIRAILGTSLVMQAYNVYLLSHLVCVNGAHNSIIYSAVSTKD